MTRDPPTPATAGPPAVSRFEYSLLRLLRFLVGQGPAEQAAPLVRATFTPAPGCLSRTAVRLAEDTLSKGLVQHLVRAGGWRRERFLRGGGPVSGRVWDRIPLDERRLEFGPHPVAFLLWLTADNPAAPKTGWDAPADELTAADELFFAVAYDHLRAFPDVAAVLAGKTAFRRNGLCWLTTPGDFGAGDEPEPPDFSPWVAATRAAILECLQPVLARRWVRAERLKGQIEDWRVMRQQGRAEAAALTGFLSAAEAAGRTDLARFVLHAAATVLAPADLGPEFWTGGLKAARPQRLADRLDTERAALALPRQVETLHRWDRRARAVGYFDDDYPASQLWKADWEAAGGEALAAKARRVLGQLEPLRTE